MTVEAPGIVKLGALVRRDRMSGEKPQAVHRLDYRPPDYRIERVEA